MHKTRKRSEDNEEEGEIKRNKNSSNAVIEGEPVNQCQGQPNNNNNNNNRKTIQYSSADSPTCYFAEYGVFLIQLRRRSQSKEELTGVVIFAGIGHGHESTTIKSESLMNFIFKRTVVNGFAALASASRITALRAEITHDSADEVH